MPVGPVIALSACLAIFICFVSENLGGRAEHHAEVVRNQFAILNGQRQTFDGVENPLPQFASRIMFPAMLATATTNQALNEWQWYVVLRGATAFTAFLVFFLLCFSQERMTLVTATLGAAALAYGLVFTFNHPWEHPTDFIDVIAFCMFLWLALSRRPIALMIATLVATFNHETAAFAGVIWWCLWGVGPDRRVNWKESLFAAAIGVASYGLSTGVKMLMITDRSVGYVADGWRTIPQFIDAIKHPLPFSWPILLVAMMLPAALWLVANRSLITREGSRLLLAALAIIVLASPIAFWSELRSVFLAPSVIVAFVATATEARKS
jgi:hypothetical protein